MVVIFFPDLSQTETPNTIESPSLFGILKETSVRNRRYPWRSVGKSKRSMRSRGRAWSTWKREHYEMEKLIIRMLALTIGAPAEDWKERMNSLA